MDLWAFFENGVVASYRDFRSVEIDNMPCGWPEKLVSSMPEKLRRSLSKSASLMPAWPVEQRRRFAYCPLCFEELTAKSVPLHFVHSWAAVWLTHCQRHGTPLLAWRATQLSGQRLLSSTLSGSENGQPFLKKAAEAARREDLKLVRLFQIELEKSPTKVYADWKNHMSFERKIGRLMAGRNAVKISSMGGKPILSSDPTFIQQVLRTIVATYNGTNGKRNPRFLAPADGHEWLWGVKQPLLRSFDERDECLTIEMLTPESRRAALWAARVMLSDEVRRFRHRQAHNPTFMCKGCIWATLVDQLTRKDRVALSQMATNWPAPLQRIVDFSLKVASVI
jgi:hypothetical protein